MTQIIFGIAYSLFNGYFGIRTCFDSHTLSKRISSDWGDRRTLGSRVGTRELKGEAGFELAVGLTFGPIEVRVLVRKRGPVLGARIRTAKPDQKRVNGTFNSFTIRILQ